MNINTIKDNKVEASSELIGGDDNSRNYYINNSFMIERLPVLDREYCHREEEKSIIDKLKNVELFVYLV